MKKKNRLFLLDLIRIIAIVLVVGIHLLQRVGLFSDNQTVKNLTVYFGIKDFYYVSWAGIGVAILIILNGFVLEYTYGDKKITYWSFIYKRLKHIYLIYWLCLIIAFILIPADLKRGWLNLLANATGFVLYTGQPWKYFVIPTAWFLSLIFYLYLIFPVLSKCFRYRPWLILLVLLAISVASRIYMGNQTFWHRGIDSFPLSRVFEFGLGIFLAKQVKIIAWLKNFDFRQANHIIGYLSDLTFPAFLIHATILKIDIINKYRLMESVNQFLGITVILSALVLFLAHQISKINIAQLKNAITERRNNECRPE